MKRIDQIRNMKQSELVELFHETPFDCAERCPDFRYGCLATCEHDSGREMIREWLEEEV